jgi:hypothetical protein
MLKASFRLPNRSNGIIVGDFHAFETVCRTLEAAGAVWDEKEMVFEMQYPPGLIPPPLWPGWGVPQVSEDEYWLDDPNTKAARPPRPPRKQPAKPKVAP